MSKKDDGSKKDKKKAKREQEVAVAEVIAPEVVEDLTAEGARLCYAEPVREGGRTVIPVASIGGTHDAVGARPLGFIEIDAAGARYTAIGDVTRDRVLTGVVAAVAGLLGALVGVALGRRGR